MEALPRHVAFQSKYNSKYLSFIPNNKEEIQGLLWFSSEKVVSPFNKYKVERAKNTRGSLVHIKCVYNNKYWRRENPNVLWITATGDEPNENRCDQSCTLFEPVYVNGKDPTEGVRFRHVQSMNYVCLWHAEEPHASCLHMGLADPNSELRDVVIVIDWDNLVILPKHVTFKGDNGLYLDVFTESGNVYQKFSSNDPGAPGVRYEVLTTNNGTVIIKSSLNEKFWRIGAWLYVDGSLGFKVDHSSPIDNTKVSSDLLYKPIKVGDNKIAVRSIPANRFCNRVEGTQNRLDGVAATISNDTIFEVSEAIVWREIYNVEYNLQHTRIYKQAPVIMKTVFVENSSSEPKTQVLTFSVIKTTTTTTTWRNNVSLKLGVKAKFEAGIPIIVDGDVIISSDEFNGMYTWGEDNVTIPTLENTCTVTVPEKSKIKVSMLKTKVSCEVPFSYTQRDMLIDGKCVTYEMDDGVYTYINSSNDFRIDKAEPLLFTHISVI
ncbi:OLC1v1009228C1 [Oldenlandia corymbosa var. corymbosa]|uniref:OLC1v1009228C1 n=1 Tax=Oldenlandia corymbosa var. corymbosa TaxID=529605 RepID=A0AAV1DNH1_OLDCO|nr:OLC1v1009228C1 [Oldenlandia corymbosa var. corymbosa]